MAIKAANIRYLKLGRRGRWEHASLEKGELHFGHGRVSHEIALSGDRDKIKKDQILRGRNERAAADDAREILDFYQLGPDCLWITFAQDHLWWTFAKPEVTWLGKSDDGHAERMRKAIGGWRNTDIKGKPLQISSLSTKLTKVASYRRTICAIDAEDYLLRRINGFEEPLIKKSNKARDALLEVLGEGIAALHWSDFETLIDVIFARSGWHRASAMGGTQKLVDLVLEQPTTGELAAVQVKSASSQRKLDSFVGDADETGKFDRLFFVCHSPKGELAAPADRTDVHVWTGREFANVVLRLGLVDWVMEKVA